MTRRRRVIGSEAVGEAHQRKRNVIEVLPGDIVTAEARDRAERLGIRLLDGPLEKPQPVRTDGKTAMRRVLWRRSPRWVAPAPRTSRSPRRFSRIAFIGAGGVGGNAAHLCANADMAEELVLIDIAPGLAEATALDLNHAAGITRSRARARGGTSLALVEGADLVLVTAGRARKPGMSRADLIAVNRRVIHAAGAAIAAHAPEAIVIVVTNPLDEMTVEMLRATGFPRDRVLGMAGTLDSARFRAALARAAGVEPADVEAITLGSHGEEMAPIVSASRIKGRPLEVYLSPEQIAACVKDAVTGGGQVVALKKTGSAVIAPAHSAVELMDHIRGARIGTVPVSVMLEGEYGISGVVLGVPCHLGRSGLVAVAEMKLSEAELAALRAAAEAIRARLKG
ncbi:MAG: malate dehydrogenase [Alphaproteobacteria bacterium]|nr:MAG: malate dehydrogenase [Alphaproteobacteria bacterium]